MYKVCIWENIVSPHQSFFFKSLGEHMDIDLEVRYFEVFHAERKRLGWNDNVVLPKNEEYVNPEVDKALESIPDWEERIHVIPGLSYDFTKELLDTLIIYNVRWIHWSERSGITLAHKLDYNVWLFNLLQPLVSRVVKWKYAKQIRQYALGVFSQGYLAKQDFIDWGIDKRKIEDLFYTIDEMHSPECLPDDLVQYREKKIFLYAGSLCKRKGIKELLNAFSRLKNSMDWILVFVGEDRSGGDYKHLVEELEIFEQVAFMGAKPIDTMSQYIGSCDVFVLPTLFDGWGAVLNEAAALGKPIISTDQCGAAFHLLEENKNGFRVQAGNVQSLTRAMQKYIVNYDLVLQHGRQSEKLYQDKFTPKENVIRFIEAMDKWTKGKYTE